MATYGGGITFANVQSSNQTGSSGTIVMYVVPNPGNYYGLFKPLSLTSIGGTLSADVDVIVQNANGIGGWVNAYTAFHHPSSTPILANNSVSISPTGANTDGYLALAVGQRVVLVTNVFAGTARLSFSYYEYSPS